jgi:type I restriction enzyme S subunit
MRKGWTETTLGEVAEVIGGGTPSTNVPKYWGNDVVWLTPTEIVAIDGKTVSDSIRKLSYEGLANSGAQILPKGSVILTSRASVGFVAISECELSTNQGFQSLVPGKNVFAYFLMYWIQKNRKEFESRAAGSTFKEISKNNVKSIKLNLPPLPEQKRIADLIASVDTYITALEKQAESARRTRGAVLHELLSAGGEGWTETTLGEVAEIQMGQSPDGSTYNNQGVGLPFMQGSAEFGEHYPKPDKWCSEPKKIAEIGDLLLSVRAPVGDTNFADQRIAVGRGLSVIRAKSSFADTKFIRIFIQSNIGEMISNSGSGMFSSITGKNLRKFSVFLPPLSEQKRIVDLISTVDDGISATEKLIRETKQLRSGLLSDLLSGEHEIPESYDSVMGTE